MAEASVADAARGASGAFTFGGAGAHPARTRTAAVRTDRTGTHHLRGWRTQHRPTAWTRRCDARSAGRSTPLRVLHEFLLERGRIERDREDRVAMRAVVADAAPLLRARLDRHRACVDVIDRLLAFGALGRHRCAPSKACGTALEPAGPREVPSRIAPARRRARSSGG